MSPPLHIGRYVLHDEIASGGMAAVHFGQLVGTAGFAKIVAIKRLHRQYAREASFRNMILEEARLAARIRHPNVVPPLDVLAEGGELLLVMEYVHGEPLSRLLRVARANAEAVPVPVATAVAVAMLHALHAAHEARSEAGEPLGLVHRDVSPQNVLVGSDGVTRVIDFGIAKAITSSDETLAGTIKGKVPYLAPEQIEGGPATRRVDIYAASVVLWEMLAGRRLYEGGEDADILRRILTTRVPPPSGDDALDAIVLAGLARRADDRFVSAREMALALESASPPAMPTQVAAWVDRLAGHALDDRAATLHRIESGAGDESGAGFQSQTLVMAPVAHRSAPPAAAPAGVPPSSSGSRDGRTAMPGAAMPGGPMAVARMPPGGPLAAGGPMAPMVGGGGVPAGPTLSAAGGTSGAAPAVAPFGGSAPWSPPVAPGRATPKWPIAAAAVVALLLVAWFVAPIVIARRIVASAADRGIVLVIDHVELSRNAIRLVGVAASSREVPEVKIHAEAVVIGLRRFSPESLTVQGSDVRIEGAAQDVAYGIGAWRASHGTAAGEWFAFCKQFSLAAGKASWTGLAGAKSEARFDGIGIEIEKVASRAFAEDWHAVTSKFVFRAGVVEIGPWQLQAEREGITQQASVRFDPSGVNPASVTLSVTAEGAPTLSLRIPPTKIAELHLPPGLLGELSSPETKLSANGEVAWEQSGARGKLGLGASAVRADDATVDMFVEVPVAGGASSIDAPFSVSSGGRVVAQGKLTGELGGGRISLFGRTDCQPKGQSYEAAVVFAPAPIGDSKLTLDVVPCPPK